MSRTHSLTFSSTSQCQVDEPRNLRSHKRDQFSVWYSQEEHPALSPVHRVPDFQTHPDYDTRTSLRWNIAKNVRWYKRTCCQGRRRLPLLNSVAKKCCELKTRLDYVLSEGQDSNHWFLTVLIVVTDGMIAFKMVNASIPIDDNSCWKNCPAYPMVVISDLAG